MTMGQIRGTEAGEPLPRQPIFIFGFPRSGTTLLQRVLNSYQDVLIWGEHVAFLEDVAHAYFRVWRNPDFFRGTKALEQVLADAQPLTRWQAWMNWMGEDDWKRLYREFVESVFVPGGLPGKRFWGWKEVHYAGGAQDATLRFLAQVFPEAFFVFLVRSGFNNMASFSVRPRTRGLAEWSYEGCRRWKRTMASFREWHASGRLTSFWIRYEDLLNAEGGILQLLEAMGRRFGDEQLEILRAETARGSSFGTEGYNERWKHLSPLRLGVALACLGRMNRDLGYANPRVPIQGRVAGAALTPFLTPIYLASRLLPRLRAALNRSRMPG